MSNAHNIENVLHHHGIMGEGDTLTDNAREAGIIYACLGCGSVGGVPEGTPEAARIATRECVDRDMWCCEDATQVIY